jgi:hypothetical protein
MLVLILVLISLPVYILDINSLSDEQLAKIFFHFVNCLLILVIVSFDVQKLLNMMQVQLSIVAPISWAIGDLFRKSLPRPLSSNVFPIALTLKYLIHLC